MRAASRTWGKGLWDCPLPTANCELNYLSCRAK